jgi:hypothetical protein
MVTGTTFDEQQRACWTVANWVADAQEAFQVWMMLGVSPDRNYQVLLRAQRQLGKGS